MADQANGNWQRLGAVEELKRRDLQQIKIGGTVIALSYRNGEFGAGLWALQSCRWSAGRRVNQRRLHCMPLA